MFDKLLTGNPLERFFSLAGLAFMAIYVVNVGALFVPPGFLNPAWELKLIEGLVEYAPLLILGFTLTGSGLYMQEKPEKLQGLGVFCFVLAGLYAIAIPLFVFDSIRLYDGAGQKLSKREAEVTAEIDRQQSKLAELAKSGNLPPSLDATQAKDRLESLRLQTLKEAAQGRQQTALGYGRLVVSKLSVLVVITILLLSFGRLCQFISKGITLDPDLQ